MRKLQGVFLKLAVCAFTIATMALPAASAEKAAKSGAVSEGKTVKVEYTLTVDNKVVDTSKGRQPIEFKVGAHQMIPGFEKAVMGMKTGEKKSFKVKPEDGYGQVDSKAFQEVPKSQLPKDLVPKAGMMLMVQTKEGQQRPVRIKEVKKDTVIMDLNHPMAGKTLNFDVEVVAVK